MLHRIKLLTDGFTLDHASKIIHFEKALLVPVLDFYHFLRWKSVDHSDARALFDPHKPAFQLALTVSDADRCVHRFTESFVI